MTTPLITCGPELSHEIARILSEARGADAADSARAWQQAQQQLETLLAGVATAQEKKPGRAG